MTRALVLGGGGVTGVAWELGVLEGLRRAGVDLTGADVVVGTSAGAAVGARVTTSALETAYDEQCTPPTEEVAGHLGPTTLLRLGIMLARPGDQAAKWRKVGTAAEHAHPVGSLDRSKAIRARLGDADWPDRDLRITAVDVDAGAFVVFDKDSGVSLLDAVSASCALPFAWPPVRIDDTTYVDGGIRSPANADLVAGAERVVVLAPQTQAPSREHLLSRQLARTGAAHTLAISPDHQASHAIGHNPLDPGKRPAAARAGLAQGLALAPDVTTLWR
ncbi:MAG: patatin-like phospholipase family protein [Nocardioidaceae bacterium]|nr:patatin-like phospholipase family protein [Nocardioidaceae bacterium]